jgi:hypothetical protein
MRTDFAHLCSVCLEVCGRSSFGDLRENASALRPHCSAYRTPPMQELDRKRRDDMDVLIFGLRRRTICGCRLATSLDILVSSQTAATKPIAWFSKIFDKSKIRWPCGSSPCPAPSASRLVGPCTPLAVDLGAFPHRHHHHPQAGPTPSTNKKPQEKSRAPEGRNPAPGPG